MRGMDAWGLGEYFFHVFFLKKEVACVLLGKYEIDISM